MKNRIFRQFFICILALCLCLSSLPASASASLLPARKTSAGKPDLPESTLPPEDSSPATLPEDTAPDEESRPVSLPTLTPTESISSTAVEASVGKFSLYFGQLHAHTSLSDGTGTVEEAFQYASQVEGLDFFAVTDHSESLDHWQDCRIDADASSISQDWAAGKAAAAAVTKADFVGMFGYEMSWPHAMQVGHLSTFNTPGFESWKQEPYCKYNGALEHYYTALASVPGAVSQFNHPGTQYGTFCDFGFYSAEADQAVTLLEVGSGQTEAYHYYTKALDLGWHLAPTNNQANHQGQWGDANTARTVACASELTEDALYEAMANCRVYATEDSDLEIRYTLNGHFMGSRLTLAETGPSADIRVSLSDPSDASIGLVEVITTGGTVSGQQILYSSTGEVTFSLPPDLGYYYLRITQPDGDTAVTAPIWVDAREDIGIAGLAWDTAVPLQNEPCSLTLELYNRENSSLLMESIEILAGGEPVATVSTTATLPGNTTLTYPLTFRCGHSGLTEITIRLSGTLMGSPRVYEISDTISFRQAILAADILVDGSHENAGLNQLNHLRMMAAQEHIRITTAEEEVPSGTLADCRFLLVTAPSLPFSQPFLDSVAAFAAQGGSVILCGQAGSPESSTQLNRLLAALGSDITFQADTALDDVNNGGSPELLFPDCINTASPWCQGITQDQVYRHSQGCTIDPGSGTWLVKGHSTTGSTDPAAPQAPVLLACQALSGGGTVFAARSLFLSDDALAEAKNLWDSVYTNRTIARNLLGIGGEVLPLSTIAQARSGQSGELFRVRGYVTAGTSNPYNTFPETVYLQDDTGGIAMVPVSGGSLQQGTPVEATGTLDSRRGNHILKVTAIQRLEEPLYQYLPLTGSWDALLDPVENEGRLVQVEGTCQEVYCREDDSFAGCLLADENGNTALVQVEASIRNGSDGKNQLHRSIRKGRTIRAMGILYRNDQGDTVIRVRNCEEVVWVPPLYFPGWNPKTGDLQLPTAGSAMLLSAAGLLLVSRKRQRKP